MRTLVSQQQLPQCAICKLDPVPQSTQHIILLIMQVALLFVNWKFSIIILMIGYSFPKTIWRCPFCSRQMQQNIKQSNTDNNVILRIGNCMGLFSLNKFRIFTSAIAIFMIYLFFNEPKFKQKTPVIKTWESLVENCGYQVYIQNSVRATHFLSMYLDSGYDWEIQGIFLSREHSGISEFQNIYIKMDPTQFKDPNAYDFRIFTKKALGMQIKRGDVIKLKGEWQGRQYHNFIFNPIQITKTGQTKNPQQVDFYYKTKSMLRSHFDSVRSGYQQNPAASNIVKIQEEPKQQIKSQKKKQYNDLTEEKSMVTQINN